MEIRKGERRDLDELSQLYDDLNDYLDHHINYPGWKKGIYPTYEDALQGIEEGHLFVGVKDHKIVGTLILRHKPEKAYVLADWKNNLDYNDIFVLYTFAIHPKYLHMGIGKKMLEFAIEYAKKMHMKAIRLDVYERNTPAIQLYEKYGFQYIDTVDLGYSMYGLDWFYLYQKVL